MSGSAPWKVFAASVRGATHVRKQLPNQDACLFEVGTDGTPPLFVAVSDGHGSERCFRSDVGSRLAVETTLTECRACLEGLRAASLTEIKATVEGRFLGHLVRAWRRRIAQHADEYPFSPEEITQVVGSVPPPAEHGLSDEQVAHAYGATLLVLMLTEQFALYLQLGDGEMLVVTESPGQRNPSELFTEVSRPLPKDESLIANETTSLCRADAERQFRVRLQVFDDRPPALILLCTDGYSNAFESPAGFEQVGGDLLRALREQGVETVSQGFAEELDHVSRVGSGDDVTVAVVFRDEPQPRESGDGARWMAPTVLLPKTPQETPTVLLPPVLDEPVPKSDPDPA
jgi:serine/threonine protein phosphatase PrpC